VTSGSGKDLAYANHIDGHLLSAPPLSQLRAGSFNKVPLLIGHTRDEFTFTKNFFLDLHGGKLLYDFIVALIVGLPLKLDSADLPS
jgi:hypothetical protein